MTYSDEQRKEICDRLCRGIAAGMSVSKCCKEYGMPAPSVIYLWLMADADFSEQYARARERRADARAERIDDLCDEVRRGELGPNEARVIIDAEKWQAGKENSKRYGDKLTLDGDMNMKMSDEQLESKLAHLLGKAAVARPSGGEGPPEEAA